MLDPLPEDYTNGADWFRYFRMTKHLPAMQTKYKAQIGRAPTAQAAKMVMTAYAAAALDVCFFIDVPQANISKDLKETFGLHPNNLLMLSLAEISTLAGVEKNTLRTRLTEIGYRVAADDTIADFIAPPTATPSRAAPPPPPKS